MRNALTLLAVFFGVLFIGTLIGATVIYIYSNLTLFVAGRPPVSVPYQVFFYGLIVSFPAFCVIASMMSILYLVRHPSKSIWCFVFFIIVNALTWLFLLPQNLVQGQKFNSRTIERTYEIVSPQYFRNESSGITFYSKMYGKQHIFGLFFDTKGIHREKGHIDRFDNIAYEQKPSSKQSIFSDSLIENALKMPSAVKKPIILYADILESALSTWRKGFAYWLPFATIGLVFVACFGLRNASKWKFLSAFLVMAIHFIVLALNGMTRGTGVLKIFSSKAAIWWHSLENSVPSFLQWISYIEDPLPVFINLLITVIILFASILLYFSHKPKVLAPAVAGDED